MSDILVLGAGPAGGTAARLLALWGHAVTLVTRPEHTVSVPLAESLTPSCGKFFDLLGIRDRVDRAGFVRTTGNTVWWGTTQPRVERFAGGARGWQVTSPALERVMVAAAEEAGARVERTQLTPAAAAGWPAAFRIDCTGRAGVLARARAGRRAEPGHRTVALSGTWRHPRAWPVPDPTHTLIESYGDGWAWSVPLDETRRAVAVMVDPRTTSLARGEGARHTYLAELGKASQLGALVRDAEIVEGPGAWDASMYASTTWGGPGWLVAGDAASFVDPLSSAGVKKALASGWLAAITAHTALIRPGMAEAATRFFADREREMYAGFLALTRRFLREGAGPHRHPFWDERADADAWDEHRDETGDREAVQAAYDQLRAAPDLRLRRGDRVCIEPRPAIAGNEIVLESRLVTPGMDAGIRFLNDIDVVTLVELAPECQQVPDLYEACVARAGPADLAAFLTTLATAIARQWLIAR